MKLKVNKKNLKKLRNQALKLVGTVACGTYIMTGIRVGFETLNNTIRCDYYDLIYNIDEDLIQPLYNNDFNSIDYDKFSKITILSVDMATTYDLGFLRYCNKKKKIEIKNAQLLNDLHIDELNETTIKEYILMFDKNSVIKNITTGFDLNRFSHKEYIKKVVFDNSISEETDSIILYEYLKNIEGSGLDINHEELNNKLDSIINSLKLSSYQDNVIDFIKIINYMIIHFDYDERVKNYMEEHKSLKRYSKIYNKVVNYNRKPLDPIFDVNDINSVDIICGNYASILSSLCLKGGVECYEIEGYYDGVGHGWNIVKFENNYYYVDLTYIDNSPEIKDAIFKFFDEKTIDNYCNLINNIFIPIGSEYAKYYSPTIDIDAILSKEIKPCENDDFFGTFIDKKNELLWYFILSTFGYVLSMFFKEYLINTMYSSDLEKKKEYILK